MNELLRQISDIISQADQINIDNAKSTVKPFSKFNDELKSYITENIRDQTILNLVNEIPNLHEEIKTDKSFNSFFIGIITDGNSSFLETAESSENTMSKIREIKGKYSSIETLIRHQAN
jgi:hypothetical protein